jgi:uncharacterized membrane protein (UPF0127 family)
MTADARTDPAESLLRLARYALTGTALVLFSGNASAQESGIALSVLDQRLTVEVADTEADRRQGLMHRRVLPMDQGMLFVFRESSLHAMWMMNTDIPLSVAFLDERGVIINIEDMEPRTLATHSAERPAKYALEVNRGWYEERGVKPGMRIEGIPRGWRRDQGNGR